MESSSLPIPTRRMVGRCIGPIRARAISMSSGKKSSRPNLLGIAAYLTKSETETVSRCLRALHSGAWISSDAEFETRVGVAREKFGEVLATWPEGDGSDTQTIAVRAALREVGLGFAISERDWTQWINVPHEWVAELGTKIRHLESAGHIAASLPTEGSEAASRAGAAPTRTSGIRDVIDANELMSRLPERKRLRLAQVRAVIRAHVPPGVEEVADQGLIAYRVPAALAPEGDGSQLITLLGLAPREDCVSVYLTAGPNQYAGFRQAERAGGPFMLTKRCLRIYRVTPEVERLLAEAVSTQPKPGVPKT